MLSGHGARGFGCETDEADRERLRSLAPWIILIFSTTSRVAADSQLQSRPLK